MSALGASTQVPVSPKLPAGPAHDRSPGRSSRGHQRPRRSGGVERMKSSPSETTSGVNISTVRVPRLGQHGVGAGVLRDVEARQPRRRHHQDLPPSTCSTASHGAGTTSPTTTRSTRRGSPAPRAAGPRRTRCGSAAARRPGSASPTRRRGGRCAARASASRGRRSARARATPARRGRPPSRRRWCRPRRRRDRAPASSTPDSSKVSRTAAQTSARAFGSSHPSREAHSAGDGPAHRPRSTSSSSKSRGSTPPPGKTHMPPAKAIEVWRRSR